MVSYAEWNCARIARKASRSRRIAVLRWIVILFCAGALSSTPSFGIDSADTLHYLTVDSVHCVASYWSGDSTVGVVVLLHMLGQDRTSWGAVPQTLAEAGFAVIAPDFRGHGASRTTNSGELDWKQFKSTDFGNIGSDVASAVSEGLLRSGHTRAAILGAAFGANVAFISERSDPRIAAFVLLSPGESYRGWKLPPPDSGVSIPILAVSAADDDYALVSARKLKAAEPSLTLLEFEKGGHGTFLFDSQPQLLDSIIVFLRGAFR